MRKAIVVVALAAFPWAALAEDLQPGKYRQTLSSEADGGKAQTHDQCITQADVDSGLSKVGIEDDGDCKVADFKKGSGSISYRMVCEEDGRRTTATTNGTFTRDSYDFHIVWQAPGKAKPTVLHAVGKRIGACSGK